MACHNCSHFCIILSWINELDFFLLVSTTVNTIRKPRARVVLTYSLYLVSLFAIKIHWLFGIK